MTGRVNKEKSSYQRAIYSIVGSLIAFAVILGGGAFGYKHLGDPSVSWLDAVYMTFLMVATIGYGHGVEVFHIPHLEIFTMVISFSGIAVMTYMFSSVTALVLASDFDHTLRIRRMEKQIKKLKNHYIVCGYGRVGTNVGRELNHTNRHFVAIDENHQKLEEQKEKESGLLYLTGDASDDDVLLKANLEAAKGVFAITGDDSRNLMIIITAKQLAPNVRIVARCHEVRNIEKMRKAGADAIISPDFSGGMRIASSMVRPHVMSFLDEMLKSEDKLRVEEIRVPDNFVPNTLGRLMLRSPEYILLAVRDNGKSIFNPPNEFELRPGQVLIAMTSPHGRSELEGELIEKDWESTE